MKKDEKQRVPLLDYTDKNWDFHLDDKMLEALSQEFNVGKLFESVLNAQKGNGDIGALFDGYGLRLAEETLRRGSENKDRTYEVILEVAEQTGGLFRFPYVPQRFLEIAYLGAFELTDIKILEGWSSALAYELSACPVFDQLKAKCSAEVTRRMPCKQVCLRLGETICKELKVNARVEMVKSMAADGRCEFRMTREKV